jgi:hypothetical protein
MRTEVVTSFSPSGAEAYGRRCVASLRAYWPHSAVVYADAPIDLPGVTVRLTDDIQGWRETKAQLPSTRPDAATTGHDKWTRKPTSYLWDAKRFGVKPFVWLDAAEKLERGILVWVDGDTVTTNPIPATLPADVLADADVAYLGRGSMHPESGVVVFRVPEALPLLRWCRNAYDFCWFAPFEDGWTDCHVLRAGLSTWPRKFVKARDLTSHLNGTWRSSVDAVALSPFGPYLEHLKGTQRKKVAA